MRRTLVNILFVLTGCSDNAGDPGVGTEREALSTGLLPDIVEEIAHVAIQNKQGRDMLRFSTTHWNQGAGPLQVRGGSETGPCPPEETEGDLCTFAKQEILDASGAVVAFHDAGVSLYHTEHNHWHQSDVAAFEVRAGSLTGSVIAKASKVTFCLVDFDVDRDFGAGPHTAQYSDCGGVFQGISVGWGDSYHHSTPGQELDITGAPAGDYYLTHLANPAGNWLESNTTNNLTWVKLRLTRQGANPKVAVVDRSPCPVTSPTDPAYQVICGNTSNK